MLEPSLEEPLPIREDLAERYRAAVSELRSALTDEKHRARAADILHGLDKIVLSPKRDGNGLTVDLYGDLARILILASKRPKPLNNNDLSLKQDLMVAGAGFEPATFGL